MKDLKKKIQVAIDAFKKQKLNEAENLTNKLILESPNTIFLYNLLGLILMQKERFEDALKIYIKGIEIDPNFAQIHNNLGLIYSNYKNDDVRAEEYFKNSIKLNKELPEPYNNLASLYKSKDRFNDAIDLYNKVIEINPRYVHAYHNLGNIYTTLGNFNLAKEKFNKAIEIDPYYTISHRTLSRIIKYKKNDKHFLNLKKLYDDLNTKKNNQSNNYEEFSKNIDNKTLYNDISSLNKINLSFALGKAYEDTENYEMSFKHYEEANFLYYKKNQFIISEEIEKFNNIKDTFCKNLYEKYKGAGSQEASPIFILGMPRSGTTLVEQILSSHPEVFGGDEQIFIPNLLKKNFGNNDLKLYFENVIDFKKEDLKNIGDEYISLMKKKTNNSVRFTDKFPENFFWIGFINLILPKSKVIHCFRNSKDNCFSLFKNHFPNGRLDYSYDLDITVEYYNQYYKLMDHWNNCLPNFIYNLKYEDLVSNTEHQVRKLLEFCRLKWDNKCLDFHKNKRIVKTASDVQARNKIYSSSINSWQNYKKFLINKFEKLKR